MAFVEQDRVNIRYFLGYGAIFLQADPRLENAISSIQAVSDGGSRPDSSSENQARMLIQKLYAVDLAMDALDPMMGVERTDESTANPTKEEARLRRKGRMLVYRLAKILDTEPRGDVFGSSPATGEDLRATAAYSILGGGARTAY